MSAFASSSAFRTEAARPRVGTTVNGWCLAVRNLEMIRSDRAPHRDGVIEPLSQR